MPPTRTSDGKKGKTVQSTLPFRSTKPGAAVSKKSRSPILVPPPAISLSSSESESDDEPDTEPRASQSIAETVAQPTPIIRETLDPDSKKWNKLRSAARERMGNIQPIHADDLTKVDIILRVFDTNYKYGPCVGLTRLERWEMAERLGLNPPKEIREILTTKEGMEDTRYSQTMFYGQV
ncbi:DNA polymerase delta, subunit 4 [Sistotremastrum niveocremeum HHB9708]|uniref:DNA polymerase delta, subunit 4 n=2 Tax=Sistotremastraceae TaxID=3402574 RepID=A0A164W1H6_9AGAM|nr:DNA polymerase delta, subunit 4 [Sistotremastrum niveocremeum HHB9708]KZT38158.1 DNA polymerase delta, subunit 4 [Sistotremastrum suecicum HHB10207 ss-3]